MSLHIEPVTGASQSGELCVSRVPLFQGLTYAEQLDVASVARSTRVDRAEQLYSASGGGTQLMVVHTGRVKITRVSADGHEQILRILGPGDFIGESAFLTGIQPDHTATALEPSQLCVFRHADLSDLFERHASIGLRMLQGVSKRLSETEARLAAVISGDVSSRLADYLLSLPAKHSGTNLEVVLPVAKKDVASLLDTTPESLSRQLRALGDAGIIAQKPGGRIVITDSAALSALES